MMSGVEWTIVTVIGVCLIVLFVILEVFFPAPDTSNQIALDRLDRDEMADHPPAIRSASTHTLR